MLLHGLDLTCGVAFHPSFQTMRTHSPLSPPIITTALSRGAKTPQGGNERSLDPHSNDHAIAPSMKSMTEPIMMKQRRMIKAVKRSMTIQLGTAQMLYSARARSGERGHFIVSVSRAARWQRVRSRNKQVLGARSWARYSGVGNLIGARYRMSAAVDPSRRYHVFDFGFGKTRRLRV